MPNREVPVLDQPPDSVVEFFDRRARDYDREYNDETPGGYALRVRRQKVIDLFDQPGGRVLDVGCGPGVMAAALLQRGCEFWGLDPSQKMLEICRQRFAGRARTHFLCGDAMRIPAAGASFDAVLCMGVIDGVRDRRQAVREMLRVLKPGGTLIVTFTNQHSPYAWWKNYVYYPAVSAWHGIRDRAGRKARSTRRSGGLRALYSERKARNLMIGAGGAVERVAAYYSNLFLSPLDELMPSLALSVNRKLEARTGTGATWTAAGFILKVRKDSH